jgi:RNA polymerase sigma-70 factor (ECF subfamily)
MNDEDAQLMCRARDGDDDAFATLFTRWRVAMVRFAVRFVGDQVRGEELAQDVFVKIYKARHRYEPKERFRAYIFRVATNHCLNEVARAEHRYPRGPLEHDPVDASVPNAEHLVDAARMQATIRAAVANLPPQQRAALLLQKQDGLSLTEIAHGLDTSVSAVKALLNRARTTLKQHLAPLLASPAHSEASR